VDYGVFVYLGIFNSVISYLCWNSALARIGNIKTSIIYYLLPMVVSAVMLFSYEGYLKYVKKQRLEKLKIVNTAQMNRNKI